MTLTLFLLPIISAFIGSFVNWLAIEIFFHPRLPTRILGVTFQGIFPKRQKQLLLKLAELVGSEMLSFEALEQKISGPENVTKILPFLETHIDTFLREKLTTEIPMLGMLIGDKTIAQVKAVFMKELQSLFPLLMKEYLGSLKKDLDLPAMISEKLNKFSSARIEEILRQTMRFELRFFIIIGAVLGFAIGMLQLFLTILTK
ncbi:MAG: DUF445 family protein [Bacteroidota bacterium]|nr:DUF445 family protein [Bacteroidota bacterium]